MFFAYDSARLTPEARIQLEPLGQALASRELTGHGFLIAGHTDAAGAPAHNRRLSLAGPRRCGPTSSRPTASRRSGCACMAGARPAPGPRRTAVAGQPAGRGQPDRARPPQRAPIPRAAAEAACAATLPALTGPSLADPRRRVALDLDDFDAAPTPLPCSE